MSEASINGVRVWLDDPASGDNPTGGTVAVVDVPDTTDGPLPTEIRGPQPPPDVYGPNTAPFRYWATASALRRASDFWGGVVPAGQTWHPTVGPRLAIVLDGGEDLNAYYDRQELRFFHGTAEGRTVFSAESPDVVTHEFGHALLDALRPALWDAASVEASSFHEAVGDISAFLTALQVVRVRERVLAETGGALYRTSQLSRLAEQLGWAIRQRVPHAVESDCLRNVCNAFVYQRPATLPSSGPASILTSESHSFSRVFSGAFFDALARVFAASPTQDESTLARAATKMGAWLVQAIRDAPIVPSYYAQIAAHLVTTANVDPDGAGQAIRTAMIRHGILSASGLASIATFTTSVGPAATPARAAAFLPGAAAPTLDLLDLDVKHLGLSVDSIRVHSATQPKRFSVAGAALTYGDASDTRAEDDAREFVEQLIRRGRLDYGAARNAMTATGSQHGQHTHTLAKEADGSTVLRRVRIDCMGQACDHARHPGRGRQ